MHWLSNSTPSHDPKRTVLWSRMGGAKPVGQDLEDSIQKSYNNNIWVHGPSCLPSCKKLYWPARGLVEHRHATPTNLTPSMLDCWWSRGAGDA
eukprot:5851695-Pyramimonas_sp.AAC.1